MRKFKFAISVFLVSLFLLFMVITNLMDGARVISQTHWISYLVYLWVLCLFKYRLGNSEEQAAKIVISSYTWATIAIASILVFIAGYSIFNNDLIGVKSALGGLILMIPLWMMSRKELKYSVS